MAVRKRGKKWVAIVYVNGKQKWKTFETEKEAKKYEREMIIRREQGEIIDKELALSEYLQTWYEAHLPTWKAKTADGYLYIIYSHFLKHNIAKLKLDEIKAINIQMYIKDKLETGLGKKTVAKHLALLRYALNCAARDRIISYNPVSAVKMPDWRREKREPVVLTVNEIKFILRKAKKMSYDTIYIPTLLAATMGLRTGEVFGLKWDDFDFENKLLAVQRTLQRTSRGLNFDTTKTLTSVRKLPLPKGLISVLKKYRERQNEIKLKLGEAYIDEGLVCCEPSGRRWEPRTWSGLFRQFADNIGYSNLHFYDFRHNNLTLLAAHNVNPKKTSTWAGHVDSQMMDKVYVHIQAEHLRDVADVIDATLFS